jgi:hypothetical protein
LRTFAETLWRVKHSDTQEIELGAAKHLALDELESIDVPLHRAIAPGIPECCDDFGFIAQ